MKLNNRLASWTRRDVIRGAAGVVALSPLHTALAASHLLQPSTFAYVASSVGEPGSLEVFTVRNRKWSRTQGVPSRSPGPMVLSHLQQTLYVANDVEVYGGLPRGTVEAFAIDPVNGTLTLVSRQALSLSATRPRSMALSPDGKLLAIAAYGGGIYNLLPVAGDGSLGQPVHSFKQTGSGPHANLQISAHPYTVLFDPQSGNLHATDFGSDRISVFSVQRGRLKKMTQQRTGAGSGPGACVMHRESSTLFVAHELEGTLASYRCKGAVGDAGEAMQNIPARSSVSNTHATATIAMHPSGKMLYTAWADDSVLTAWAVSLQSGRLMRSASCLLEEAPLHIVAAPDGQAIFIAGSRSIQRMTTNVATGEPGIQEKVAAVPDVKSIALKTL